ncbi:glycosyltransferase family 2 protein [Thermodesulfobacteriota bacterium]
MYIIMPCYNEERTVYDILEQCLAVDLSLFRFEKAIIIVDDGSTDRSRDEVARFVRDYPGAPIRTIRLDRNRGKGYAIRKALELCDGGYMIIQDADLEYSPSQYPELLKPIFDGVADVVYGSRWIHSGPMSKSGWLYALGGWLENVYLHLLYRTNISDIATCYKVMSTSLLKRLDLECKGFEFCPEVTAKLLNRSMTIMEVPIQYKARKKREGKKIRWIDFFKAIGVLTKVRLYRT